MWRREQSSEDPAVISGCSPQRATSLQLKAAAVVATMTMMHRVAAAAAAVPRVVGAPWQEVAVAPAVVVVKHVVASAAAGTAASRCGASPTTAMYLHCSGWLI